MGSHQKREARSEKREARSEKREARSEKREARSEKREARSEKREARSEKRENFGKLTLRRQPFFLYFRRKFPTKSSGSDMYPAAITRTSRRTESGLDSRSEAF
ncbi:hypothetical protein L1D54_09120 [Vibrio brasiliensis]|uniref:hypothetical protein n=1 Tax=Vibrio brasiliensis TaxID=170652 RepID=UPI001EFC67D2|nr:hypothetical protein [Vibrio brasiliensis]MCG9750638.1 hypothetical protein [Vibrio brasiliensis]